MPYIDDPFISEFKAANEPSTSDPAKDFVEIVVEEGTDVSDLVIVVYKGGAKDFRQEYSLAGEVKTQTIAGKDVYLIDNADDGFFLLANDGLALATKIGGVYTVHQAITDGVDFTAVGGPLDGVEFTDVTVGDVQDVPSTQATVTYDGINYEIIGSDYTPGEIVCFCSGTLITTAIGDVAVDELVVGEHIQTLDDGFQTLRWIGSAKLEADELNANPHLVPIRIKAGALGQGLPTKDLLVSPQHRVLVRSKIAQRMFGDSEILVPAKKLLEHEGIEVQRVESDGVRYFHLLFDKHQIIFSNGSPTESLYTGRVALNALSHESRLEIKALFPEIFDPHSRLDPVRPIVENKKLANRLVYRHLKNAKEMYSVC